MKVTINENPQNKGEFLIQIDDHKPTTEEIMDITKLIENYLNNVTNTPEKHNHNEIFKVDECPMYKDLQKYHHLNPANLEDSEKPKN